MNFITQLFSHHPAPAPANIWMWTGQSGKQYRYEILPLEASFKPLPGLYIYAMANPEGGWVPVYISQTRDLHQRLEGHVRLDDAVANGATHLHAHYCEAGAGARCAEEEDLVHQWQPVCNDVFQN